MVSGAQMSKIAIIVRAGRLNYKNVVTDLIKSLQKFGHIGRHKFNLYISVDLSYEMRTLSREDFQLKEEIESKFESVRYIFDEDRQTILSTINTYGIASPKLAEILLLQKPYGYQINSALIYAISDRNEMALHFDDDQGFAVPIESSGASLKWIYMDVVGWHICGLQRGATVTTGPIAGSVSPIPQQIKTIIPERIRRELGKLFEHAHEFLDENSFLCPKYRILSNPEGEKYELVDVPKQRDYRWISPANMGINLQLPFPVFYNPKGARGEDAFFAMSLDPGDTLFQIPAYIFHDPFLSYPGIYENKFPKYLAAEPVSPKSINRFANAVLGWINYTPLFLRIRFCESPEYYKQVLKENHEIINGISTELTDRLRCSQFLEMSTCLDAYNQKVEIDYKNWLEVNSIWKEDILPWLHEDHPKFDSR